MANPICLSPLKFYDTLGKQERFKTYAYGHVAPLITLANVVPDCTKCQNISIFVMLYRLK